MSATTTKEVLDEFARVLGTDKKEGRVTIIANATNVPDEGDDIVLPGAVKESLLKRKPKVILGHDWKKALAKVVDIKEYPPGSRALKRLLTEAEMPVHGWPEEAGAIVAEIQFNFDTQRGRDAFADVVFYEGEGEWSIGYRTRESYRKNGIRYLKRIDLYEISLVLHGMNRWSKTLSIKDVFGGSAPPSTDRGFGQTAGIPMIAVRKRDKGWALVRTETDTDLRFFGEEDEAYEALRRMQRKGDAFLPSERIRMAEAKIALPDGSMPIITTDDLLTAVPIASQMGEPVREHVLRRATIMGRKDLVEFDPLETKKDYSKAKREEFAKKGWALKDGSFPIADREDLKNAISLAHLGKDPKKAWAHILKRAKALGAMDVVPDEKKALVSAVTGGMDNAVTDNPDGCGCGDDCPEKCECSDCPVKEAFEAKHGRHNQQSHGNWARGGPSAGRGRGLPDVDMPSDPKGVTEAFRKLTGEDPVSGSGTKDDPFVVRSPEAAIEALGAGHHVQLEQPSSVSTFLDRLREMTDDKVYDLCKVSVPKTNLFCLESKGKARAEMPQLGGKPSPGSKADDLPKNDKGEVDLTQQFIAHMNSKDVDVSPGSVPAENLRASQEELNGSKVAGMVGAMESGDFANDDPIFVSKDDYVVDGHHRWAAAVAYDTRDGVIGDQQMNVTRVDMSILELLDEANKFAAEWGIAQRGVEVKAGGADRNRGNAEHLRRYWTRGAGAAKIRWGVKNDFYRCVALVSKYMTTPRAKGYCANRHKDATGHWPGKGPHAGKSDEPMQEGYIPPEGMVIPANTDYSGEDLDLIIEMAESMDPNEHPDEIEISDIGLGAKGMDSAMVAAMAVNAFRDLRPDYEESEVEVVRDGIKTLADVLGDDHELHLHAHLFPEENAAFAATSVKSLQADLTDDEVDTVREAVRLMSEAAEWAVFGMDAKHAGPWTEEYQPGKHTGPDKPGFKPKGKKRKPKKPSAPSIKPKKTKPKAKPDKWDPEERRARLDRENAERQRRWREQAERGKANVQRLRDEAAADADVVDSPRQQAVRDKFIPTGEYDREDIRKVTASDLTEGDMVFSSTGLRQVESIEEMDGDRLRLTMAPDEEGKAPKVRIVEKDAGVNAVPRAETADVPDTAPSSAPVEPSDEDFGLIRDAADEAGFNTLADALDPDMRFDVEEWEADIDDLRSSVDDRRVLAALDRLTGESTEAPDTDESRRERLRAVASSSVGADDPLKDRPHFKDAYENYVSTLGTEATSAYMANLPEDHRDAAAQYTGEKYRPINRALRAGDSLSPPAENEIIAKRLDEVFDEAPPTTKQGTVYRGLSGNSAFVASLEPGAVVEDEGFGSTSTSEEFVTSYFANSLTGDEEFDEYGIMLNVTVPKGSKVLPMASVSDVDVEQEVLLPRGSKYRVTGKRQTATGGYIVDVELVND